MEKLTLQQQLDEAKAELRKCVEVCRVADAEFLAVANRVGDLGLELGLLEDGADIQADEFIQDLVDRTAAEQEKERCRAFEEEMRDNEPICQECGIVVYWCGCE